MCIRSGTDNMKFDKASPEMSKQSTGQNIPREVVNLTLQLHDVTASSTVSNYAMCTHANTNWVTIVDKPIKLKPKLPLISDTCTSAWFSTTIYYTIIIKSRLVKHYHTTCDVHHCKLMYHTDRTMVKCIYLTLLFLCIVRVMTAVRNTNE